MIAARPESNTGAATPTDEAMTSNPLHLHVVTLLPGVRSKYPAIAKYPRRPRIGARTAPASPGPPDPLLPPVGQRDHSRLRVQRRPAAAQTQQRRVASRKFISTTTSCRTGERRRGRPQGARGVGGERIPGARRLSGEPRWRPRGDPGTGRTVLGIPSGVSTPGTRQPLDRPRVAQIDR